MNLLYGKARWGTEPLPLEAFLQRTRACGFDATEIDLTTLELPPDEVAALHRAYGLQFIAQIVLQGDCVEDQLRFLEDWFPVALDHEPLLVNFHTGRDFFSFEENLRVIRRIQELGKTHGVPVVHETHRGRAFYSAVETRKYLEACPEMRLNADFSHWMVVHESDLSNQAETVRRAVQRSRYVHARVGYEQGPQVPHPRAPEWARHVEVHIALWRGVIAACRESGEAQLVFTPEFGPPPYLHTLPFTDQPVADGWDLNVSMMEMLRERLAGA